MGENDWDDTPRSQGASDAYDRGWESKRNQLARILTASRIGHTDEGYLKALDEIAEASGLSRRETVEYVTS